MILVLFWKAWLWENNEFPWILNVAQRRSLTDTGSKEFSHNWVVIMVTFFPDLRLSPLSLFEESQLVCGVN